MILVIDVETSIKNKGNPFTLSNTLEYIGIYNITEDKYNIYIKDNIKSSITEIQDLVNRSSLLIGFNFRFDLHWLRRAGITWPITKTIWDVQLAKFILSKQTKVFPSLNDCLQDYGLPLKLDTIENNYWSQGVDTKEVPEDLMVEYLKGDLLKTAQVYQHQQQELTGNQLKLFRLQCRDLLVLEEMEWNGIKFDFSKAEELAIKEEEKIQELEKELRKGYGDIPINFDSNDHLSRYLYGGQIEEEYRLPIGVYKTGAKVGQPRYKVFTQIYELPKLLEPLKGSELKKEGYYATNEPTLRQLRGRRESLQKVELLLQRATATKLLGTYYRGLRKTHEEMDWEDHYIHGQFNQVVAATSRIASSKPNLQNFAGKVKELIITRY